jgi:hypothetical protein
MGTVGWALIAVGALLLAIGLVYLLWARRTPDHRWRRALRASGPGTLAGAVDRGGSVRVTGTVVTGAECLNSPRQQQPCVLFRFNAMRQRGTDSMMYETLHRETGEVPFWIDDGTGRALVRPTDFRLVLRDEWVAEGPTRGPQGVPKELQEWLVGALGRDPVGLGGRRLRFEEKFIAPGQTVTALGALWSEPSGDGATVKVLGAREGQPLFVTNLVPEDAVRELGSNVTAAMVMTTLSVALILAGGLLVGLAG